MPPICSGASSIIGLCRSDYTAPRFSSTEINRKHYMRFSIIVPCYNHMRTIGDTLRSLTSQVLPEGVTLEVIVVDGASTDGSVEEIEYWKNAVILSEAKDLKDPSVASLLQDDIIIISEPDEGQTDALIKGFARSSGEVMAWLNSDDLLKPGAFKAVVEYFTAHPEVDVVYGDMELIDVSGSHLKFQREIDFDAEILLWDYCYIPQPSTFWRRRIWERVGGLDGSFTCAMDYDLWMRFVKAGAVVHHVPQVFSRFRKYPEQKNQALRSVSDAEDMRIRTAYLEREPSVVERVCKKVFYKGRRIIKRMLGNRH